MLRCGSGKCRTTFQLRLCDWGLRRTCTHGTTNGRIREQRVLFWVRTGIPTYFVKGCLKGPVQGDVFDGSALPKRLLQVDQFSVLTLSANS